VSVEDSNKLFERHLRAMLAGLEMFRRFPEQMLSAARVPLDDTKAKTSEVSITYVMDHLDQ
jgi:hypothetical protein